MSNNKGFDLEYLPLRVSLTALVSGELPPFLGSTLHGVIGHMLYALDKEAYEYLYVNGNHQQGQQDTVKPYVIISPRMEQGIMGARELTARQMPAVSWRPITFERGSELSFKLLLIGDAVRYAPVVVTALQNIGHYGLGAKRYPFMLNRIIHEREQRLAWQDGTLYPAGLYPAALRWHTLNGVTGTSIRLCTPLRIRRNGKLLNELTFSTLMRNITNRIDALTQRYGGWADGEEIMRLQRLAENVHTVRSELRMVSLERYSNRIREKMDFGGLMGTVEFEGELTDFVPWLYSAQILHFGRNTTFGMGEVEVCFV